MRVLAICNNEVLNEFEEVLLKKYDLADGIIICRLVFISRCTMTTVYFNPVHVKYGMSYCIVVREY